MEEEIKGGRKTKRFAEFLCCVPINVACAFKGYPDLYLTL